MLKIIIGPQKEGIITVDGKKMRVFALWKEEGKKLTCLHEQKNFPSVEQVSIFDAHRVIPFQDFFPLLRLSKVKLPQLLEDSILEFLRERHGKADNGFDCYAFTNRTYSIEPHRQTHLKKFWRLLPKPRFLKRGDVLFFILTDDIGDRFRHAAIYIGYGKCISVYGAGGDLEVSTISDMEKDFGATDIFLAIPKT